MNPDISKFSFTAGSRNFITRVESKTDKKLYLDKILEKPRDNVEDEEYIRALNLLRYPYKDIDLYYETTQFIIPYGERSEEFATTLNCVMALNLKVVLSSLANIINGGEYNDDLNIIELGKIIGNKLKIIDNEITDNTLNSTLEDVIRCLLDLWLLSTTGTITGTTTSGITLAWVTMSNNFELLLNKLFVRNVLYNNRIYNLSDSDIRLIGMQISYVVTLIKRDLIRDKGYLFGTSLRDLRKIYFNRCNYLNEYLVNNFEAR